MKLSALLSLLFVLLVGAMPASAAYAPARTTSTHSSTLPAHEVAAYNAGAGVARGAWKQKLASRVIRSKAGRWMLKTVSRIAAPAPAGGQTNTISLVAGILGIVALTTIFFVAWLPLLAGVAALVLGVVGLGETNKKGEGGKGWALLGIIGGSLALLIYLLAVVILAAIVF